MRKDPISQSPVLLVSPVIDKAAFIKRCLTVAEEVGHLSLVPPIDAEIVLEILTKVKEQNIPLTVFKLQGLPEESIAPVAILLTQLLPQQVNLQELDLSKNNWGLLNVDQFKHLASALKACKKLHSFSLSGAALSLDQTRVLSIALGGFPVLETLILGGNHFNEDAVKLLLSSLYAITVKEEEPDFIDKVVAFFYSSKNEERAQEQTKKSALKCFTTLSLSHNSLGLKGADQVAKWLRFAPPSFHTLYLSRCQLGTAGLQALEATISNCALKFQELCLDGNGLDDQSIPLLLNILGKQPQIRYFQIKDNAFTLAGLTQLQQGVIGKFDTMNKDLKECLKKELKADWLLQTQSPNLSLLTQLDLWESILALYPYDEEAKTKKMELLLTLKKSLNEFNQVLDKRYQHEMKEGGLSDWNQPFRELVPASHKTLKELWSSELDFLNVVQDVRSKVLGLDPRLAWRLFEKLEDILTLSWPLGKATTLTRQNFAAQVNELSTALQAPAFLQHYASLLRYSVQYPMIVKALENDFMTLMLASSDLVSEKQPYQALLSQWIKGEGLLMAPIQRLMRYELLLRDLLNACRGEAKPGEAHPAEQMLNSLVAQIGRYATCSKNGRIQANTPLETIVELLRSSQERPDAIPLPALNKLSLTGWMSPTRTSEQLMKEATARDPHATLTPQIELKMGSNEFILLDSLTEREAKELFKQEGLFIAMPLGQKTVSARLGNGYFGELTLAKYKNPHHHDDQFVAVKKITHPQRKADSEREDYIHKQLNGLMSIIPFYGSTESGGVRYALMALGGLGNGETLRKRLATQLANGQLSRPEALKIVVTLARSLLQGLSEMHSRARICHLDLKPENLVLNGEGRLYIIDFGCARSFVGNNSRLSEYQMADQRYFSLQRFIQHHQYKHKQPLSTFDMCKEDSWAAGVCLWEILQNEDWLPTSVALNLAAAPVLPLGGWNDFISRNKPMPSEPAELWDLIRQLLTFDENQRPTCEEMLKHSVFQKAAYQFASPQEAKAALRALEERERVPVVMNPGKEEEGDPALGFVVAAPVPYLHDDTLDLNAMSPHQPILVSSAVQWVDNNNNNNAPHLYMNDDEDELPSKRDQKASGSKAVTGQPLERKEISKVESEVENRPASADLHRFWRGSGYIINEDLVSATVSQANHPTETPEKEEDEEKEAVKSTELSKKF